MNGRIVPLHYKLKSGDFVEVLTSKQLGKGPSRDWLSIAKSSRARNKVRQWWSRETREDTEQRGRESLEQALKQHNLPYKKIAGSQVLAGVIREMNFKKAEDFYLALGSGKLQVSQVVTKVLATEDRRGRRGRAHPLKPKARSALASQTYGINVPGVEDVLVRMAKCCNPVPGDHICGYISLGKGITIHREDCPNVRSCAGTRRFTESSGTAGRPRASESRSRSTPGTARGCSRTWRARSPSTARTSSSTPATSTIRWPNWYVARSVTCGRSALLGSLRNIESVFDAYRVTPS